MSDSEQFRLDISKFIARAKEKADEAARKIIFDMGTTIMMASPVGNTQLWKTKYPPKGYVGGRFRANWQFGDGSAPSGTTDSIDPDGQQTLAAMSGDIASLKVGDVGYIANNLPYAWRLEYGWSTQAPDGMVRIAIDKFQDFVDKACADLKDKP